LPHFKNLFINILSKKWCFLYYIFLTIKAFSPFVSQSFSRRRFNNQRCSKNYSKLFEITIGNTTLHFFQNIILLSTLKTIFFWTFVHSSFTIISHVNCLDMIHPNNIILPKKKSSSLSSISLSSHLQATNNLCSHLQFTRYIWLRFLIHVFNVNCESLEILIGLINEHQKQNTIDSVIIYRGNGISNKKKYNNNNIIIKIITNQ
jgi:hypothetical protein